ncbi:monooxygenase [Desertibaculum subflavum]|uniref:monooxygenase n=1 Tax=Desertibaculum subflavum TaxID=2268458 RepID=UPI000E673F68
MTTTLVQFDFPFAGPWGPGMEAACRDLARDIAAEPGLIWKLWGENEAARRASGVYLFAEAAAAERYVEKHAARLAAFGVAQPVIGRFTVHAPLSRLTRAPL